MNVVIDGERFVPESHLVMVLSSLYRANMVAVANLCDEHLDKSGALLGYVREAAKHV